MKIYGITGLAGAGKNVLAGLLAEYLSSRSQVVAIDAVMTGMKRTYKANGWDGVTKGEKERREMQDLGAMGRETDENYWIDNLECRRATTLRGLDALIISDVRFQTELDYVLNSGGIMFGIEGRGGLDGDAGKDVTESWVHELIVQCHALMNHTPFGTRETLADQLATSMGALGL